MTICSFCSTCLVVLNRITLNISRKMGMWGFAPWPYQGAYSNPGTPALGTHLLSNDPLTFLPIPLNCHLPKISGLLCLHCIYLVKLVYILKNSTEKTVFDFLKKIVFVFSVPTSKDIEMEVFKKVKRTSKVACTVFYYSSLQYTKVKNNGKVFSPLVV